MRLTRPSRLGALALAGLALAAAGLVVVAVQQSTAFGELLLHLHQAQRAFTRDLAAAVDALRETQNREAFLSLLALGFAYGVFHAVGPGHGKAVIATYVLTHESRVRRTVGLSAAAAAVQGLTAIGIVGGAHLLIAESLRRTARSADAVLEPLSYGAVATVGFYLAARGWRTLRRGAPPAHDHGPGHDHGHGHGSAAAHGESCGHHHTVTAAQVEQASTWPRAAAIALAVGIRPCSGAIIVLVLTFSLGLFWSGVAAVAAMSSGTALTVALLALVAQGVRVPLVRIGTSDGRAVGAFAAALALLGGLLIALVGTNLLYAALTAPDHPFR
jgi:nickel/cobalt exporter